MFHNDDDPSGQRPAEASATPPVDPATEMSEGSPSIESRSEGAAPEREEPAATDSSVSAESLPETPARDVRTPDVPSVATRDYDASVSDEPAYSPPIVPGQTSGEVRGPATDPVAPPAASRVRDEPAAG